MAEKNRFSIVFLVAILAVTTLAGCSRQVPAPISNRPPPPANKIDHHIVSAGETLYSIAWRYGLDHRKLATANGIRAPDTIYSGQRLTLDLSKKPAVIAAVTKPAAKPQPSARPTPEPTSRPRPKPTTRPAARPRPQVATRPAATEPPRSPPVTLPKTWRWQWPVKGRVVRYFDTNKRFKGIHIHAKRGSAVKAAGPGVVVYAGNGLHSYGRSIIVKHSDVYLSFYALNRRLLVKEGDRVAAGQTIAEVGGDLNDPNRIYFEIRRDGNSTDPIRLLPRP